MPAVTGSGVSVNVIDRSAEPLTTVVAVAVFRPGPGSAVVEAAVAVALSTPVVAGATATTMVAVRATVGAVGSAQVQTTGLAALHNPPALGVAETKVVPAGSGSVMFTPCASEVPPLVTVAV